MNQLVWADLSYFKPKKPLQKTARDNSERTVISMGILPIQFLNKIKFMYL